MTKPRTTPTGATRALRRSQAVRLRADGATFADIGTELGITRQSAHRLVTDAIRDMPREDRDQVVAVELDRLDALHRAVWPSAMAADLPAVDRVLRIMERRARLLGLDADPATAVTVDAGVTLEIVWPAGYEPSPQLRDAVASLEGRPARVVPGTVIRGDGQGDDDSGTAGFRAAHGDWYPDGRPREDPDPGDVVPLPPVARPRQAW